MSEAQEQAAVIEWCDWHHVPVFHIPNGGRRDPKGAAILARTGVKSGTTTASFTASTGSSDVVEFSVTDSSGSILGLPI